MAHVSVAVATVEPNSTPGMNHAAGETSVRHNKVRKDESRDGKSFADAMKKAGLSKSSVDKPEKKAESVQRLKNRRNIRNNIVTSGKMQILTGKFKVPESEDVRIPVERTSKAETDEKEALLSNLVDHSALSEKHAVQTVPARKRSRIRRVKTARSTLPGKIGKSGDLTSSAPRIEVIDKRNRIQEPTVKTEIRGTAGKNAQRSESVGNRNDAGESVRVEDRFVSVETDIELSPRAVGKGTERSAAAELARKLDAQAGTDIVRQVKIVLNRANAGEVQINLRPDNLGRVRVRIQMVDNRLVGRIFVESAAAHEAFRSALDGLQAKLVENGFSAADLELAWDESPRDFTQNDKQSRDQQGSMNEALREFENMIPTTVFDEAAEGRVNMVV